MKTRIHKGILSACAIALLLGLAEAGHAQEPAQRFPLSPGIVVDRSQGTLFVMDAPRGVAQPASVAVGGITALQLQTGEVLWQESSAIQPLEVTTNNLLMSVARSTRDDGNNLPLIVMDEKTGEINRRILIPLEPGVTYSPVGNSQIQLRAAGNEAFLTWQFESVDPYQALPTGTLDNPILDGGRNEIPPAATNAGDNTSRKGMFRINLESGETQQIDDVEATNIPELAATDAADVTERHLPNVSLPQYLSADGRHVVAKERTKGAEYRYLMRVFDRESRQQIGEFPSNEAYVPFYVETFGDSRQIVLETPSAFELQGGQFVEVPRQVRVMDLATGEQIWSRRIAEREFRGQIPP